jgi:cyclopropane fatty-acyl-phospholipid synthase-like methyltransferase
MTDWHEYWNRPTLLEEPDPVRQVGKTVGGVAVADADIDAMACQVISILDIATDDRVLDLCCGNGLITWRCSAHCRTIVAVDFSRTLLATARNNFWRSNIEYVHADVRRLPAAVAGQPFSKAYMYEALQHFTSEDVEALLGALQHSHAGGAPLFLASIPDAAQLWSFYDTPARREEYRRRSAEGTEAIGRWWTRAEIVQLGEHCGYGVTVMSSTIRHVAHYRFDALLTPHQRS